MSLPRVVAAAVAAASLCRAAEDPLPPWPASSPFAPVVAEVKAPKAAHAVTRDCVAIVNNGYDALVLRVHLIRAARRSIEIQTFIWTNDECGRLLMYELIEAARRGVRVRILADHLVSDKDPDTVAFLATVHPNLQIKHYRPTARRIRPSKLQTVVVGLSSPRATNQRMHNKIMVFDGAALITGGRNIENTYFDHSTDLNFKDRDVLAIGPVAGDARRSFEEYWTGAQAVASRDLYDVAATIRADRFRRYDRREDWDFGPFFGDLLREVESADTIRERFVRRLRPVADIAFLADPPGKGSGFLFWGQGRITRQLTRTIAEAEHTVILQSPYLVLSDKASELFRSMRARRPGLRIVVSSNSFGSTDNLLAYSANYRLRASYIEGLGLEVHEYRPLPDDLPSVFPRYAQMKALAESRKARTGQGRLPFLCIHAKSLVVDRRTAFIGSFNLDPRSENLNTEAGLLIRDEAVAAELAGDILRDASARNSWTIARRQIPLHIDKVNRVLDELLGRAPVDLWPFQNTTSFELVPGRTAVPPGHPDFYTNYREAGDFPGAEPGLSTKEIMTRLYKAVGVVLTPMI
jgi:putative cardiolipin synthase